MNVAGCTRRTFLRAAAVGVAALPLGVHHRPGFSNSGPPTASLGLFDLDVLEREAVARLDESRLPYATLSLHYPERWHEILGAANGHTASLVVVGRPAIVFAISAVLVPQWRIALKGRHRLDMHGKQHHMLEGVPRSLESIASTIAKTRHWAEYAVPLASLPPAEMPRTLSTLKTRASRWPDGDLESLLLWRGGHREWA
jgi:hypothetical protein